MSCGPDLPCSALPCPAVCPLGALCPGKKGSWGSSFRIVEEVTISLPLLPLWHQILSCRGLALLTWPELWATPLSGHLSREGQCENGQCVRTRDPGCCRAGLLAITGCPVSDMVPKVPCWPRFLGRAGKPAPKDRHTLSLGSLAKAFPFKACFPAGKNSASLPQ